MKKQFFLLVVISFTAGIYLSNQAGAQSPEKMSYQAVVRNSSNALVTNQPVGVKITILQGSATGTPVFAETHTPTTNANGLINIVIGTGSPAINGLLDVVWSTGPYFIKTEIDPAGGTAYSITSTSELLSVPYALYAKKAESTNLLNLPFAGSSHSINNAFSVKNNNGIAIVGWGDDAYGNTFGVVGSTNSGVGIGVRGINKSTTGIALGISGETYSSEGVAVKGIATSSTGSTVGVGGEVSSPNGTGVVGFSTSTSGSAVGVWGISNALDGTGVSGESKWIGVRGVNSYNTSNGFGVKGEVNSPNAIAVMGESKSQTGDGVGVKGTSVSSSGKGVLGENRSTTGSNYGVYGFSASSSGTGVYGESYRCGVRGNNNTKTGEAYGVQGIVYSSQGIAVEGTSRSSTGNTHGVYGNSASSEGTGLFGFCGSLTGNTKGVVGYINSPDGFSGYFAGGKFHVRGRVGVGTETPDAGIHLKGTGFPDTFMFLESATGNDAGFRIYEGTTARWHIFNSVGANGLQIYNNGGSTAIFCKQDNSNVGIGTTTPAYKLQVGNSGDGTQARANAWNTFSDARLKKDFSGIDHPLEMVDKLNGYYYYWKDGTDQSRQVGFSAQEIRRIMPEVVSEGDDGLLSVEYGKMTPLLLEAIKALKTENDRLKTENSQLKAVSERNEIRMTEIENNLRELMLK